MLIYLGYHLCTVPSSLLFINSYIRPASSLLSPFFFFAQLLLIHILLAACLFSSTLFNSAAYSLLLSLLFRQPSPLGYYHVLYKNSFMAVCIPPGIRNGQPCLFAFCLLISFQLTKKNVTVGAYFNITVGYLLSSGRLANASQQYKFK